MRLLLAVLVSVILLPLARVSPAQAPVDPNQLPEEILDRPLGPRSVDLAGIKESRIIRVLVAYNRTNFFLLDGRMSGRSSPS